MSKYKISGSVCSGFVVTVEADNVDEAEDKAYESVSEYFNGNFDDFEIELVEKLGE